MISTQRAASLIIFACFCALFILPGARAISGDNLVFALDCGNTTNSSNGVGNAVGGKPAYTILGPPGGGTACFFDGSTNYIDMGDSDNLSLANTTGGKAPAAYTISMWLNATDFAPVGDTIIMEKFGGTPNEFLFYTNNVAKMQMRMYDAGANRLTGAPTTSTGLINNRWNHFMIVYNGTNANPSFTIYINGVNVGNTAPADTGSWIGMGNSAENFTIGSNDGPCAGDCWTGAMDRMYVWKNVQYNASDALLLNSSTCEYPFTACGGSTPTTVNTTTIFANNLFDNSSLQNYTVQIYNSTFSVVNSTNSGSVGFYNYTLNGTYTINITNPQFYTKSTTVTLNSTTQSLYMSLYQSTVTVNLLARRSATAINFFNVTYGTQSRTVTNGSVTLYASNSSNALVVSGNTFWANSTSVSFSNLTENTMTLNVTTNKINVTARGINGATITNFTVNITRLSGSFVQSEVNSTTNAVSPFDIEAGQYNISINADGFALAYQTVTFNATPTFFQVNFTLFVTNAFNISFFDEVTLALLSGQNVTMDLISDSFSGSYNTSNGTLLISLLVPESYTLRYRALPSYPERFYYFVLPNQTHNNLNLYLLSSAFAQNVTITVIDEVTRGVDGAQVTSLRYNQATNSYIIQEISITNNAGQTQMQIDLNDEYYKFIITYNGVIKLVSTPDYVRDDDLTFQIVLGEEVGDEFFSYNAIDWNIEFNNNTNNFVFTYSDGNGLADSACLHVYSVLAGFSTQVNSSCPVGAAGSIVLGVAAVNGTTYRADASIITDGVTTVLGSAYHTYAQTLVLNESKNLWYLIIVTFLFAMLAFYNIVAALILAPLPNLIWALLGWSAIEPWAALTMFCVCAIVAVLVDGR